MSRISEKGFVNVHYLTAAGLSQEMLVEGVKYVHSILDTIDVTLLDRGAFRLANMMELANFSTFIGNLLGSGIAEASKGIFHRNGPHKYPDLLSNESTDKNVEIKVALENNKPKGHLAKPGYYLTCRYVLCDAEGLYIHGQRGDVAYIWELRFGKLEVSDFNTSNTEGDSGKTAVVNAQGMRKLQIIYTDLNRLPLSKRGKTIKEYHQLYNPRLDMIE
jgi:hypothetical protein